MTQCQRCNAYKTLVSSLESQLSYYRAEHDKVAREYREAVNTLDSERQMNSILTEELEDAKMALNDLMQRNR